MDGIKEWISDNLRYILLGIAIILVLVVAVLGVRTITNFAKGDGGSQKESQTEATTMVNTDVIVETESQSASTGKLVQNDAKVLTMMTAYYTARTNKDTETLKKLDPSIDTAQEQANLDSSYVESYSNIKTYSAAGPAEGSCVVYVCYDGKVKDINTLVPSLTQFYLKTNESGSYYIADPAGDTQAEQFIEEMRKSTEVQQLIDTVAKNCESAENSDPVLKDFMDKYGNSQEDNSASETNAASDTENGDGTEMVAIEPCNIRAEGNTEAEIVGSLYVGDTIMKIGETDDGWTQVDLDGQTAYIKSELLATPEEAAAQNEADYFAPPTAE